MNAIDQHQLGLYQKFNVTRTDGKDAPGEKHHGDEYFVLNLTTDKNAVPAIVAYADACEADYPLLAADLRAKDEERGTTWKRMSAHDLTIPACAKVLQIDNALNKGEPHVFHAVDVANYCMMIADVSGGLVIEGGAA